MVRRPVGTGVSLRRQGSPSTSPQAGIGALAVAPGMMPSTTCDGRDGPARPPAPGAARLARA
ncbi:MAG TPA: hypothetical protein VK823_08505 [Streptosporangiaceae bacterium]|nr:hypothetical protein [Streptosporangiaceae bacterium]